MWNGDRTMINPEYKQALITGEPTDLVYIETLADNYFCEENTFLFKIFEDNTIYALSHNLTSYIPFKHSSLLLLGRVEQNFLDFGNKTITEPEKTKKYLNNMLFLTKDINRFYKKMGSKKIRCVKAHGGK